MFTVYVLQNLNAEWTLHSTHKTYSGALKSAKHAVNTLGNAASEVRGATAKDYGYRVGK